MERALDRIAELHEGDREPDPWCSTCDKPWPCPTRRLCDEAGPAVQANDITWEPIVKLLDIVDAANDLWTACDDNRTWCSVHSEKQPCAMAVLGLRLVAYDGVKRDMPYPAWRQATLFIAQHDAIAKEHGQHDERGEQ